MPFVNILMPSGNDAVEKWSENQQFLIMSFELLDPVFPEDVFPSGIFKCITFVL